jgi:hypothetical protein
MAYYSTEPKRGPDADVVECAGEQVTRTTIYAAFSGDGVPCINVHDFNRARLESLVNDRRANGEALPGEHIVHCTLAVYNTQRAALGLPPVRP